METWDVVRARRNVRSYTDQPLPDSALDRILRTAWMAPSAYNRQNRDFVVCTDRTQLRELSRVWQYAGHVAGAAALVVVVLPASESQEDRDLDQFDAGQAVMAMMLVAADLGIGSGHSFVSDQALARQVLGLPEDRYCPGMVAFGYPVDRPLSPLRRWARRPFEDVVHSSRW